MLLRDGEAAKQRTSLGVLMVSLKQTERQECRSGEEGVQSKQMDQVS